MVTRLSQVCPVPGCAVVVQVFAENPRWLAEAVDDHIRERHPDWLYDATAPTRVRSRYPRVPRSPRRAARPLTPVEWVALLVLGAAAGVLVGILVAWRYA